MGTAQWHRCAAGNVAPFTLNNQEAAMLSSDRNLSRVFALAVLLMGAMLPAAQADDDDDDEEGHVRIVSNPLWKTECGACHVTYPPRMLPAESWRALMSGLDKHFGSDASLDNKSSREISAFLEAHASRKRSATPAKPPLRITETRWFQHEHRKALERTRNNPKVKSPANCEACHLQAESGDYSERNIKVPR
jgi:hypothetical protein